jgi:hypothetical protein
MKVLLMALLVCGIAFAKEIETKPFKIVMTGGSGAQELGGCWLHVSDGTQLYVVAETEAGLHMPTGVVARNCNSVSVGTEVHGAVIKNGKYLVLWLPDKNGKPKQKNYRITSVSDANTTQ